MGDTMSHESGDGAVRITSREIYDEVRKLSGDVRQVLDVVPLNESAHAKAHDGYDRRLENHGDRIRDVERILTERGNLPGDVAALRVEVARVKAQQDRNAWLPALIAGLTPTVIAAIVIANLLPKV